MLIELPASLTEKTLQTLDQYLISEKAYFEAVDDAFAILSRAGARGARRCSRALAGVTLELAALRARRGHDRAARRYA